MFIFVTEDHMLDWHSYQICSPQDLEKKSLGHCINHRHTNRYVETCQAMFPAVKILFGNFIASLCISTYWNQAPLLNEAHQTRFQTIICKVRSQTQNVWPNKSKPEKCTFHFPSAYMYSVTLLPGKYFLSFLELTHWLCYRTRLLDMEFLLENCLKVDYTTSTFISSPVRQDSPFLIDEDSGLGMEMVSENIAKSAK